MDAHQDARTTPLGRRRIVDRLAQGWTVAIVADAMGIDPKTVRKWRDRFAAEGAAGLQDRSSRPHRSPTRLDAGAEAEIARLRREHLSGPSIAGQARRPLSIVGAVLRRLGLGRLAALDPRPPVTRYEREPPGELIHIDTRKLGRIDGVGRRITGHHVGMVRNRGIGWDHLHVAVDAASWLAYTEILPNDRQDSATGFLTRAIGFFGWHGIAVERVMTDNGSAYRSRAFAAVIRTGGLRHVRTRPYTPRTNGKAERFIQSNLREWAYARPFATSAKRTQAMRPWIGAYNHSRPHAALGGQPPISRITKDNLLGNDT
ncbi:IS481 family transposase [Methylobacterium durans]|uniref:IS481 family transposase n=1 Tax=Methylobacterium durans TaxID=2202825 RepID=A0A2U8W1Y3_9HYPH|nr:IS481 family transposase [Methylobacterium durans]AWN40085.1 IS481 family transposase [Methylobacterium durans]